MSTQTNGTARRLPAGRKAELAARVQQVGQVTVAELASHFNVSIDTIRRDLDELDRQGAVIRTHGGAVSATERAARDRGLDVRLRMQTVEKEKIAQIAAELVEDGAVVLLNAGTTTLAVARALREHRDLTIATNNLRIPGELSPAVFRDLYVFGGSVRAITQATTGPVALAVAPNGADIDLRADLALVAVGAVDPSGYSTSNLGDSAMMAEMIGKSDRTAILADSSKLGRRLFAQVAPLEGADFLVTDQAPEGELAAALAAAEVRVLSS